MLAGAEELLLSSFCPWSTCCFQRYQQLIYTFDVTHFWVDSLKSGEIVGVASRFEFKISEIGRKQIVTVVWPMTAVWLTLLL